MFNDKELQFRDFPIDKDYGIDEPFFRVITEYGEVQLPKLPFQMGQPLPDTINCKIRGNTGHSLLLSHNMPRYVSEFYADGFSRGQEFEFKVIGAQEGQKGNYRLVDEHGLTFKLHETKVPLVKGQSVKCRFEALASDYFVLRRSAGDVELAMRTLSDFVKAASVHGLNVNRLDKILRQIPELTEALDQLSHGRPVWVMTAIRAIRPIMPRIFRNAVETCEPETVMSIINGYERVLLSLLQGSGFLRNVKGSERTSLQAELTAQIEQVDIYRRTFNVISRGEQHKFIDNLLQNLKESGYIYHPTIQFSIMMILFRMQPELVNSSLGNIFDTLMGWDPQTWKTEPFRQAFVEQLEIYISEAREDIDRFLQAETASDNEMVEKVLTAIAIQQCLANTNDIVDTQLNRSLLYRYLSLLRTSKAETLLNKSYLALMGVALPTDFTWSDIKEPTMMMTRASVDPPSTAVLPPEARYYLGDKIEVEVGPEGIAIARVNDDSPNAVPNNMLGWPGSLGLRVNAHCNIRPQKMKSMEGHSEFWSAVETELFMPEPEDSGVATTRRMADIGDSVLIKVVRVIHSATDYNRAEAFECQIVDDHFVEDCGLLPAENIVNYNLHGATDGTFRNDSGEHMVFEATVVDIDDNDTLIFSLLESTRQAIRDMANAGDKCYCVVTKDNGRSYSAISENGFGLYVNKENDGTPPFHRGNVLRVTITGTNNEAIQSVVDEGPIDNHPFYNNRALHNLLRCIAIETGDVNDDVDLDDDQLIDREDMLEIIDILRYKAVSSRDDIIRAFDYLSYARLLALIVDAPEIAATLKAHKDLLLLHQHYAKNKAIFLEDIIRAAEQAPESTLIQRLASRLEIVAALGNADENPRLWDVVNHSDNEMEQELAQMVLSHNMLWAVNHDDPTLSTIKDCIAKKLNVESVQRSLKYYGSESQYVEFKSSLVYPAQKGKAGVSAADPDKQEFEILHIIAGMMNTQGGTLYIGVNDDHYERGLEDDFTFYRLDQSERNTKFRRSIKSLDNMANYLQNIIDNSFSLGKNAGEYAHTAIDDESVKGVIYVKVDPCPHIVYLDGKIYARHGAKTEPIVRKDEIDLFIADREIKYRQLMDIGRGKDKAPDVDLEDMAPVPAAPAKSLADQNQMTPSAPAADEYAQEADVPMFSVGTSRIRRNILHEYNDVDHFVPPMMYIRFVEDNKYIITKDEWSIAEGEDRLALIVTDEEIDDYLVMVYDDEYAVKVRIRELAEKINNVPRQHHGDRKLVFATIVPASGGLYAMYRNNKNTLYERVTPIDRILQGSMATAPERLMEAEGIDRVMYEVVRPLKMLEMGPILSTTMKRAQIGSLVKGISTVKTSASEAQAVALKRLQ